MAFIGTCARMTDDMPKSRSQIPKSKSFCCQAAPIKFCSDVGKLLLPWTQLANDLLHLKNLAQPRQRVPQPLLEALGSVPATAESKGSPAATMRAASPSGGSGYCTAESEGGPAATMHAANTKNSTGGFAWRQRTPPGDRLWKCE